MHFRAVSSESEHSVYEHLAIIYKKRIINLSQKKARPPLGVALPRCERLGCSLLLPMSGDFVAAPTARNTSQS
jgi:hypothetical protein